MKFGEILECCMTNISNKFSVQCWRMEASSGPFYDFIKMSIKWYMVIFNSWRLSFLNVPYSTFKKMNYWNLNTNGYGVIEVGSCIEQDLELSLISPSNFSNDSWKLLPLFTSISWPSLVTSWVLVQKIYSEMHTVSCTNTDHDVTDLVNHWMVKNMKT